DLLVRHVRDGAHLLVVVHRLRDVLDLADLLRPGNPVAQVAGDVGVAGAGRSGRRDRGRRRAARVFHGSLQRPSDSNGRGAPVLRQARLAQRPPRAAGTMNRMMAITNSTQAICPAIAATPVTPSAPATRPTGRSRRAEWSIASSSLGRCCRAPRSDAGS